MSTPPTNFSFLWVNHSFINQVKIKNSIFSSAKRTDSPSLWAKYHSYCNKTIAYLRHLKFKFFHNLLTSPSPQSFWSAVKCIHSKHVSIPSIIHNGSPVTSSSSKANVLNQYFSSCFNRSTALYLLWLIVLILHYKTTIQIFSVIQMKFAASFLVFLLTLLLVLMVSPLSCSTTQLLVFHFLLFLIFNSFLSTGIFPSDWKTSISYLFLNWKPLLHSLQSIAQSLYFPS